MLGYFGTEDRYKFFKLFLFSVGHIGTSIKTLTEKVEKTVSNQRNVSKPVGGINVAEAFIKRDFKEELKVKSFLLANYREFHRNFIFGSILGEIFTFSCFRYCLSSHSIENQRYWNDNW